MLYLIALALCAAIAQAQAPKVVDCGLAKAATGVFSALSIGPGMPAAGAPIYLSGVGSISEVRNGVVHARRLGVRARAPAVLRCARARLRTTATPPSAHPLLPPPAPLATSQAVTGGSADINVLFMGVPLYQGAYTTCGSTNITLPLDVGTIDVVSLACPTVAGKAGGLSLNVTVSIPVGVPSGGYEVIVTANDQAGKLAYCVDATFTL